jgi:hypothetical protein
MVQVNVDLAPFLLHFCRIIREQRNPFKLEGKAYFIDAPDFYTDVTVGPTVDMCSAENRYVAGAVH